MLGNWEMSQGKEEGRGTQGDFHLPFKMCSSAGTENSHHTIPTLIGGCPHLKESFDGRKDFFSIQDVRHYQIYLSLKRDLHTRS